MQAILLHSRTGTLSTHTCATCTLWGLHLCYCGVPSMSPPSQCCHSWGRALPRDRGRGGRAEALPGLDCGRQRRWQLPWRPGGSEGVIVGRSCGKDRASASQLDYLLLSCCSSSSSAHWHVSPISMCMKTSLTPLDCTPEVVRWSVGSSLFSCFKLSGHPPWSAPGPFPIPLQHMKPGPFNRWSDRFHCGEGFTLGQARFLLKPGYSNVIITHDGVHVQLQGYPLTCI